MQSTSVIIRQPDTLALFGPPFLPRHFCLLNQLIALSSRSHVPTRLELTSARLNRFSLRPPSAAPSHMQFWRDLFGFQATFRAVQTRRKRRLPTLQRPVRVLLLATRATGNAKPNSLGRLLTHLVFQHVLFPNSLIVCLGQLHLVALLCFHFFADAARPSRFHPFVSHQLPRFVILSLKYVRPWQFVPSPLDRPRSGSPSI
jgi:hypothetical protein